MEELLKWLKGNFTTKTTSRDNLYTVYWVEFATGKLYNDKELLAYFEESKLSGPKKP